MTHTENLLKSIEPLKNIFNKYYDELFTIYSAYSKYDIETLDDYVKDIFYSSNRSFFTICSKESFNNLETEKNWNNSIVYSPLNDHSRLFMKKGDIVFCYRQGQFTDLKEALNMRGIYALGFVASEPKLLFPDKADHNKYGVAILFPFGMKEHLELRNIQLNPITISLTPYNGNRNDALQYIPENEYSKSLLEQICRKNPYLRKSIENTIGKNIEDKPLPDEIWNMNSKFSNTSYPENFSQTIYYGVPGCGKSHKVDETINAAITDKNDREHQVIRVVFHPDYTNADFVGQIMPLVDDGIEYRFKAGPFTRILKHAYKEHSKKFFLVIEELNRGNAAAIFGDLFQLLDREKDGFSTYSINNPDISSFIMSEDDYHNDKILPDSKDVGGDKWILDTPIRLPPNLSILATMNTSDQNVFVLDNAFQRRWKMEYIPNSIKYENMEDSQKNQYDLKIGETNIKWGVFREKVNEKISGSKFSFSNAEDKQLGLFFIKADSETDTAEELLETDKPEKIPESDFANKVLKYLWNDVFKRNPEELFLADIKTFGDLLLKFKGSSAFGNCFDADFVAKLKEGNNPLNYHPKQSE